jgi:hypothetical protein
MGIREKAFSTVVAIAAMESPSVDAFSKLAKMLKSVFLFRRTKLSSFSNCFPDKKSGGKVVSRAQF